MHRLSAQETLGDAQPLKAQGISSSDDALEDSRLMEQISEARDEQSFLDFMMRYHKRLFATCYRMLGSRDEAEEALQESFLKVWTYAERWSSDKARVSTWVYTITMNTCRDILRKRKGVFVEHQEDDGYGGDNSADGVACIEEQDHAVKVKAAIDALPERQKKALILSYYQGLTHHEIGDIMGVSAKSVEGLVARARQDLKKRLSFMQGEL